MRQYLLRSTCPARPIDADLPAAGVPQAERPRRHDRRLALTDAPTDASGVPGKPAAHTTRVHRFPLNNFRYYFTLFSKCFSSFLHSTCSLSVSRQYLALDGVHHPIKIALPSNPTRRTPNADARPSHRLYGALTLCGAVFKQTWSTAARGWTSATHISTRWRHCADFKAELFPLQSPLLRESWLVSVPPVNNMLKFTG